MFGSDHRRDSPIRVGQEGHEKTLIKSPIFL
jgi:hypothetical protein